MTDERKQQILHDFVIPKYSALATAKPSRMLLIGMWMILLPMTIGSASMAISLCQSAPDAFSAAIVFPLPFAFSLLCAAVLFRHTRRCIQ